MEDFHWAVTGLLTVYVLVSSYYQIRANEKVIEFMKATNVSLTLLGKLLSEVTKGDVRTN